MDLQVVPEGGQGEPLQTGLLHQGAVVGPVEEIAPHSDADADEDSRSGGVQHLRYVRLPELKVHQHGEARKDYPAEEGQARPGEVEEVRPLHRA